MSQTKILKLSSSRFSHKASIILNSLMFLMQQYFPYTRKQHHCNVKKLTLYPFILFLDSSYSHADLFIKNFTHL
jgi:hypothetical protein